MNPSNPLFQDSQKHLTVLILGCAALLIGLLSIHMAHAGGPNPEIMVYKSPTCGCCTKWVEYLEDNGYPVKTKDVSVMDAIKKNLGVDDSRLKSCHTAVVEGYVVEGHVPVADIERLLKDKPPIAGLTAPGMPMYSPGMASIEPKNYDVLSFDHEGNVEVYSRY